MSSPVITIYKNGDHHFLGKKLVVNRKYYRTFDYFLDKVTQDTQAGFAIRKIHTPQNGTKVINLENLKNGNIYVAAGPERFKRLAYDKIVGHLNTSKIMPTLLKPVYKNKINITSRYKKDAITEPLKNRIIYVFRNGEDKSPPVKLLLDKRTLRDIDAVLQFISNKIQGAVRSLYCLVTNKKITNSDDINSNMLYVAVGSGKHFIKMKYDLNNSNKLISHNKRKRKSIHAKKKRINRTGKVDMINPSQSDEEKSALDLGEYRKNEVTSAEESALAASPAESINETVTMSTGTSPMPTQSLNEENSLDSDIAPVELERSKLILKKEASTSTNEDISESPSPVDLNDNNEVTAEVVTNMINEYSENAEKTVETHSENKNKSSDITNSHEDVVGNQIVFSSFNSTIQMTTRKEGFIVIKESKQPEDGHLSVNTSTVLTDEDVRRISATSEKIDTISTISLTLDTADVTDEKNKANIDKGLSSISELVRDGFELLSEDQKEEEIVRNKVEQKEEISVYKASGQQQESGDMVKDDKNTAVEELIDTLPAEEVEEELEKNE